MGLKDFLVEYAIKARFEYIPNDGTYIVYVECKLFEFKEGEMLWSGKGEREDRENTTIMQQNCTILTAFPDNIPENSPITALKYYKNY